MSIARLMQQAAAGVPTGGGVVWTDPDLANASYDSVSFSVAGEVATPMGIFFKPDGSKAYVLDFSQAVNEYDLGTVWDISSASYVQNFSVSAQEIQPRGLAFKPDGTKMYVVGSSGDDVNEYDLSTSWDISTASFVQAFRVASQDTSPASVFFKPDGTKMYVLGMNGDDVNEYDLSAAWDVSSASYLQNFSVASQEATPNDVFFNPDGTKMYVAGNTGDDINEYDLSTAWDVSASSYNSISFSVAAQEAYPTALSFSSDGSKMYVLGLVNKTIYQYSTD